MIDGKRVDISAEVELDETKVNDMDAVVDRFVVGQKHEKAIKAGIAATLLVGDGLLQVQILKGAGKAETERFYKGLCSPTHHFVYGDIEPEYFMFNNPESACRTCGGLGIYKITHPELLVPDPKRSILGGCFVKEAFKYNPDTWDGRVMYSLSKVLGFSLDTPWEKLPETVRNSILYGLEARKIMTSPAARRQGQARGRRGQAGRLRRHRPAHRAPLPPLPPARRGQFRHGSVARQSDGGAHLPGLQGRARPRHPAALHHRGQDHPRRRASSTSTSCTPSSARVKPTGRGADAGRQVLGEIRGRLRAAAAASASTT